MCYFLQWRYRRYAQNTDRFRRRYNNTDRKTDSQTNKDARTRLNEQRDCLFNIFDLLLSTRRSSSNRCVQSAPLLREMTLSSALFSAIHLTHPLFRSVSRSAVLLRISRPRSQRNSVRYQHYCALFCALFSAATCISRFFKTLFSPRIRFPKNRFKYSFVACIPFLRSL